MSTQNTSVRRSVKALALGVIASLFGATTAHAGYTTIKNNPAEAGQMQIIAHTFGGSWHEEDGDFYSGGVSAKRIDDFMTTAGVMNIANGQCGDATDQKWTGKSFTCTAIAKFSDYTQTI